MSAPQSTVADALARWRNNLIDLSRRNPLLSLRSNRSSVLELSHPAPPALWQRLVRDAKSCTFWLPPEIENEDEGAAAAIDLEHIQTKPGEIVCGDLGRRDLLRVLTNLYRRAGAEYRERGLQILHVTFGVLQWRDQDQGDPYRSPLVLVPVELERASLREPFRLQPLEDSPMVNPALTARLQQDFDFQLPPAPESWDEAEIAAYLKQVEAAIAGLPGWSVETAALLSLFSFFKGVMYRDLEEHAALAERHPLIRALAGQVVGDELTPTPLPSEDELDGVQPPEKSFTILNADASQRLCLEAAARGHSFVLHGPPGTGKSQTIANLIAECLASGKKVLFVSDKMAALEVVFNRLREVGLDDFCLELHSHKANKRVVVSELKRCLENARSPWTPSNAESNGLFDKLRQRRDQLTGYVEALHELREPLQRSAWWALGEMTRCADVMTVTWNLADGVEMTPVWLDDSRQALQRAEQLWHIPEQGPDYPWAGFKVSERYTLKLRDEVVSLLEKAKKQLDRLFQVAEQYAAQLGVKGSVAWLLKAGELLETSPRPPAAWLTATNLTDLAKDLEKCTAIYQERDAARAPLAQRYGNGLWRLAEGAAAAVDQAWHQAAPLLAPGDEKGAGLLTCQQQLRGWAADTQKRIPAWLTEARTIEKWLGVGLPQGAGAGSPQDTSVHWLKRLLRLAHLCSADTAPERSWVVDAEACTKAQTLIESNQPVFAKYHSTRQALLTTYTEQFFELELDRIADGFAGPYQSWLRVFNLQFRRDRRTIARRSRQHQMPDTIGEDIFVARDLMHEKARLENEQAARKAILGRYERGLETDFDAAGRATRLAAEAVAVVRELGHQDLPEKFIEALSAASPPPEKIRAAIKRLGDSMGAWSHSTEELQEYLPLEALPGVAEPLEESSLSALQKYAHDLQTSLNHFAGLADPVLTTAKAPPPDAVTLIADLRAAEALHKQETQAAAETARWAERFGPAFHGVSTDWAALRKSLTWTQRVREHFAAASASAGTPQLPSAAFVGLATGPAGGASTKDLRHALEQFQHALHHFEIRFEPPGPVLHGKPLNTLPPEELKTRLEELKSRAADLSDWVDWHHLGKRFEHLGLREFWVELQKARPPRQHVADIFLKSTLAGWLDRILQTTPALANFRRQEHDRIVSEFRTLDEEHLQANATRVAQAAEARRPTAQQAAPGEESAVLMREAHKKSRHLPIRRLFEEIPNLILQLKPCLLMSPLSVSQFLDATRVKFDVVVFDEASQIYPEDAIGAVLRARQVIVTGDDKQLPPTSFFQQLGDDEDDYDGEPEETPATFESVLDACLGAGLRPHFLRWHYRSRREGLIAYSNQQFYDNRLMTFPGPFNGAAAGGVGFLHVPDGVYDRGGRRDNQREAQVVADLVLDHFRRHGDAKTLGVIAFSQAQMFAIEDEIERRLAADPELEPLFKSDRLGGFFVKNLETVQGDERDVIILSVGYGRDTAGKMALHFGPLNRAGGQRRLNVAVTRARESLLVVSSIRAADLDVGASKSEGVRHLHRYLSYAEQGMPALGEAAAAKAEPQTPVHADVAAAVRELGYEVISQIGCGEYRIDLAVVDPRHGSRFLLGIECDGPSYHATPTARDRDRLRHDVLTRLGWKLHRIWSAEWFQRRAQELARLGEVLSAARQAPIETLAAVPATTSLAPRAEPAVVGVRKESEASMPERVPG